MARVAADCHDGSLVVLTSRVCREKVESRESIARELAQAAKAAACGIGPPVVEAAIYRLRPDECAGVADAWEDKDRPRDGEGRWAVVMVSEHSTRRRHASHDRPRSSHPRERRFFRRADVC
jgi:hypothetical protein